MKEAATSSESEDLHESGKEFFTPLSSIASAVKFGTKIAADELLSPSEKISEADGDKTYSEDEGITS